MWKPTLLYICLYEIFDRLSALNAKLWQSNTINDWFGILFKCLKIDLTFGVFRDFRPTSLERSQEKVRLRIYKMYAWGVPLLISGCAATLDHMRKNSLTENVYLQPRFCEKEYWFAGKRIHHVYNQFSSGIKTKSDSISK